MKFTSSARKYFAAALASAGLAWPACAAVCPKGIGGCTSPGRCFLFTDANGNSLCDYTAGSASSQPLSGQPPSNAQAAATPVPLQAAGDSGSSQATATAGTVHSFPIAALIAGTFLFIALSGILYTSVRKGFLGIHIGRHGPALAFSVLIALGISLMAASILAGGAIQGMVFALAYLVTGTLLSAYLWHENAMSRRIILAIAGVSTLTGFVFTAPIMPSEFLGIFYSLSGAAELTPAILLLCAIIVLAVVTGRAFCGHICPVGSLQELAYAVPVKKTGRGHLGVFAAIRLLVFGATVIAAIYAIDLMALTGLFALFTLTTSILVIAAAALVLLSVFVYRPVCRALCPIGLLFSIPASFSLFRLRRNRACIVCRKCEKACPAGCAGADDSRRECYLCGRCTESCPVDGALAYRR